MLVGSAVRRVAIVGGVRIPFARSMGAYAEASNQQMLSATLTALVERYQLKGEVLGDVGAGAVLKHSRDFNLTRESVLDSGLAPQTPAFDLQRACGTSLDTAIVHRPEDRDRPDRLRHRSWRRYRQRRARRLSGSLSAHVVAQRARSHAGRTHQALGDPAPEFLQTRAAGRCRTAHRPVDGRELRADGEDLADQPRRIRTSWRSKVIARPRPLTTKVSSATWSYRFAASRRTTMCVATRRSTSWPS